MISGKPYTPRGVRTVWEGVDERPSGEGRSEAYLMMKCFIWAAMKPAPTR